MLDIRLPIGSMFLVIGFMLAAYGFAAPASFLEGKASYHLHTLTGGYNLTMWWGIAMALFGGVMFGWMSVDPYDNEAANGE